jgi:hypothetical protein
MDAIINEYKNPDCDGIFFKKKEIMRKERRTIVWYEKIIA